MSPDDTGMTLGPFRIDAAGGLAPIAPDAPPCFTFHWRDRAVHASLVTDVPPDGRLLLRAWVGRIPSSARSPKAARRTEGFSVLRGLPAALPAGWRVGLAPDHRVLLQAECAIALPITATGLIGEVTNFLLALGPYLDVLDEAGLAGSPEGGGSANTWPG